MANWNSFRKEIERLDKQREALTTQRDKALQELRTSFDKQKKELLAASDRQKTSIYADLKKKEHDATLRKGELQAQMDAELKGLGVDVNQLAEIRRQLQKVSDELKYINEHLTYYISWQNDKREYFDLEQQKKDERKQVRQKIDDLQDKFQKRKQQYDEKISSLSTAV